MPSDLKFTVKRVHRTMVEETKLTQRGFERAYGPEARLADDWKDIKCPDLHQALLKKRFARSGPLELTVVVPIRDPDSQESEDDCVYLHFGWCQDKFVYNPRLNEGLDLPADIRLFIDKFQQLPVPPGKENNSSSSDEEDDDLSDPRFDYTPESAEEGNLASREFPTLTFPSIEGLTPALIEQLYFVMADWYYENFDRQGIYPPVELWAAVEPLVRE